MEALLLLQLLQQLRAPARGRATATVAGGGEARAALEGRAALRVAIGDEVDESSPTRGWVRWEVNYGKAQKGGGVGMRGGQ